MHKFILRSPFKIKLGEYRWTFLIIGFLAIAVFSSAYIAGFNSNFVLFTALLIINLWIALVDLRKGITLFLVLSFVYGFLNRVSYNFSPVNFNFLYAYPQFALFGISAIAIFRHIQKQRLRFKLSLLDKLVLVFLAWSFLQAMNPNQDLAISLYGIRFRIVPVFMYFLARIYIRNVQELKYFYRLLILLAILTAGWGIYQRVVGLPNFEFVWIKAFPEILVQKQLTAGGGQGGWYNDGILRVFSTFSGGNEYSYVMAFLFIFLTGFNPIKSERRWQIARTLAIVLIITMLLVTRERTPLAMIAVGLLVLLILRIYPSYSRIFIVIGLLVVFITLAAFAQANRTQLIHLLGGDLASIRLIELVNPFAADTVLWRIEEKWIPSLEKIGENLIGYGLGASRYSRVTREGQLLIGPHNTFLEIGLELGVIGLFLFLLLILEYVRWTFVLKSQCRQIDYVRFLPDTLLAVLAAALACAVVSTVLLDTAGLFVWLILGLTPVMSRLVKKQSQEPDTGQYVAVHPLR